MKALGFILLLTTFWMLLSGYTLPLLLFLGACSVLLTFYLSKRMNVIDHESYPMQHLSRLPSLFIYLFHQIILANIDVVKRIVFNKGQDISPTLVELPLEQKSDLGKVIYANSITLTPGTVSVSLSDDKVLVHALSKEGAEDLQTGSMSKTICEKVED